MLFKRDEVIIDEHTVGQRGIDESLAWCEGGWALVLRYTVVDEGLLDCSEVSVQQWFVSATLDVVGVMSDDSRVVWHFKVLMINILTFYPYKHSYIYHFIYKLLQKFIANYS